MPAAVSLALRRARHHVTSLDDARLLMRVAMVMAIMPALLRMALPRLLEWLDRLSRRLSVPPGPRAERVERYCRGLGGLRWWSFQDNCVVRSLTLFTLLNRPTSPIDVVFGVRQVAGEGGPPRAGRRHVWLEREGAQLHETEPIDQYVVAYRYSPGRGGSADDPREDGGEHARRETRLLWSATGLGALASFVAAALGVGRTKIVAAWLGPPGIAVLGQVSTLALLLSYLATFGAAGAITRFVREAAVRDDEARAAGVVRGAGRLLGIGSVTLAFVLALASRPIAQLALGDASRWPWVMWLVPAVPAAAGAAVGWAVLRGYRDARALAVGQSLSSVLLLTGVAMLSWHGAAETAAVFPLVAATAQMAAVTLVGWSRLRPALARRPLASVPGLGAALAAYGGAGVLISSASALVTLTVGRALASDEVAAGHFFALAIAADGLLTLALAGYHTYHYPTLCSAPDATAIARLLRRLLRGVQAATLVVFLALGASAPLAVPLLLSDRFTAVVPLIGTLLAGVYLRALAALLGLPLLAKRRLVPLVALHLVWGGSLLAAFFGLGVSGGASSWAAALVLSSAVHVALLAATLRVALGLRSLLPTIAVASAGALLLLLLPR